MRGKQTQTAQTSSHTRRGLVYSLSIFFMLAVILSLGALWLMHSDRYQTTIYATSDAQMLSMKMDEMKWLCMQSFGINLSAGRNISHRVMNVSDSLPLAVAVPVADLTYIRKLNYLINGSGTPNVRGNWSSMTNLNVSKFNITKSVVAGLVLNSTRGQEYVQDRTDAASDVTRLYQGTSDPQEYIVSIVCTPPPGATQIFYSDPAAGGSGTNRTIYFASAGNISATHSVAKDEFDPTSDQLFEARYYDDADPPYWVSSIHADWSSSTSSVLMWSEFNNSYGAVTKSDITCNFNISMTHADNGAVAQEIFIPIDVDVRYNNATYSGNLSLVRE